jgi:hypothetical protein
MNSAGKATVRCRRVISTLPRLERLAKSLERRARELRELVEEQHAAVRERDLARSRDAPAPDQTGW